MISSMYQPAPSTAFVSGKKSRILAKGMGDVTPGQMTSPYVVESGLRELFALVY